VTDSARLVTLCEQELVLCGVKAGERLAVVSQGDERLDYADAFLAAAARLGASCFHLRLPAAVGGLAGEGGTWRVGATPLAGNHAAVEALKGADIVIDLIFLLFSREQLDIQAAGARVLTCIEPVDHLTALFPTREMRARVERAMERLARARTLRFTNRHGTDVAYRLGAYPVLGQYGYTDEPGRWDHWPSGGFVYTGGADDGVDGVVVIAPGDILLPFKRYASEPIELTIRAGTIRSIAGGGVDGDLVRDYIEGFGDPDGYAISHIGWGLEERARWSALSTDPRGIGMAARCFAGNVLFSTGPNSELGGSNSTPCHIDVPMRDCSLYLDDEPIVLDGRLVAGDRAAA
jgi:2,5-dihydroxypyridine 5,6-dioxygenase